MDEIKILIADDHPIFRSGLKNILEKQAGFAIVGEAENGKEALNLIRRHAPDIAVLDLDMPEVSGFGVARELRRLNLTVDIVILTMHNDAEYLNEAIDLGVRGYIIKDGATAEIINCIKSVAGGREYFSSSLSPHLLSRIRANSGIFARPGGLNELTPTERRVLYLLAEFKTSREIGEELGAAPRTVNNHRARICQKLGLQGSHALTKFALQNKERLS